MHRLLALLIISSALYACNGAGRPLTTEEFYGYCWPQQMNVCWDDNLCATYKAYLEMDHASKADCIAGCNKLQNALMQRDAVRGCMGAIGNATDWCEKYCRLYFDYGPPSKQGQGQPQPD